MKSLIIAGTGIKSLAHLTKEVEVQLLNADMVLYLLNEPLMVDWVSKKAKRSIDLNNIYHDNRNRDVSYKKICDEVVSQTHLYNKVCLLVYGHPTLLSDTVQLLLNSSNLQAHVIVIPGISSLDCLLADLTIDPVDGMFAIEATRFILGKVNIPTQLHTIIWQIGMIGNRSTESSDNQLDLLQSKLLKFYDKQHEMILYEASLYPHLAPRIKKTKIYDLCNEEISRITTAYIPPAI